VIVERRAHRIGQAIATFGLRSFSAMATPARVPPVPTGAGEAVDLAAGLLPDLGPVVRYVASRLATLSNWLAQIAPFGSVLRQFLGQPPE
jgi:hypothetical protein